MIPKIIHLCWFGGQEKPPLIKHCIESWKKYCPDYEIMEWNESNFDIELSCDYVKEAYSERKWAFVSDFVRLRALYEYGGIYLDTDMELVKPLDPFLEDYGFLSFESRDTVCLGIIGTEKENPFIKMLLDEYYTVHYFNEDGTQNMMTNVVRMRKYLEDNGLRQNGKKQVIFNMTIYPQSYFLPYSFSMVFGRAPKGAVAVHYGAGSWNENAEIIIEPKISFRSFFVNKLRNVVGTKFLENVKSKLNK